MELAHDRTGAGPPLVLIHGIGSRRGAWRPVVEQLAAERETVALDLPGFGDSPPLPPGTAPTVDALADAVEAFIGAQGLARPHVAGNSLGGGIALELGRRGAVRSVAALSPVGFWTPAEVRAGGVALRVSHRLARDHGTLLTRIGRTATGRRLAFNLFYGRPARKDPDELAADVAAMGGSPSFAATLPHTRTYVFRDGQELRVPVTIGWGTRDRLLRPRQAARARERLPRARHVPLPHCGHVPMSDDPAGVAALLREASA